MALVFSHPVPKRLLGAAAKLLSKPLIKEMQLSLFGNSFQGRSLPAAQLADNEIKPGARPRRVRTCEPLPCRIRMNPPAGKPQPCNYCFFFLFVWALSLLPVPRGVHSKRIFVMKIGGQQRRTKRGRWMDIGGAGLPPALSTVGTVGWPALTDLNLHRGLGATLGPVPWLPQLAPKPAA